MESEDENVFNTLRSRAPSRAKLLVDMANTTEDEIIAGEIEATQDAAETHQEETQEVGELNGHSSCDDGESKAAF